MQTTSPQFAGVYLLKDYKRYGQTIDDQVERNKLLGEYLKKYSGLNVESHPEDGVPQTPDSWFAGFWQLSWQKNVVFTDDEHGDHFSQAKKLADKALRDAETSMDPMGLPIASAQLGDGIRKMIRENVQHAQLEAVAEGDETEYRLNVLSKPEREEED